MGEWAVVDGKTVTPRFDQLAKYITTMEKQGWELKFVDTSVLYFRKGDKDDRD